MCRHMELSTTPRTALLDQDIYVRIIYSRSNVIHEDFVGCATHNDDALIDVKNRDRSSHGTYIAGLIESETHRIAKNARLIDVKIMRILRHKILIKI